MIAGRAFNPFEVGVYYKSVEMFGIEGDELVRLYGSFRATASLAVFKGGTIWRVESVTPNDRGFNAPSCTVVSVKMSAYSHSLRRRQAGIRTFYFYRTDPIENYGFTHLSPLEQLACTATEDDTSQHI